MKIQPIDYNSTKFIEQFSLSLETAGFAIISNYSFLQSQLKEAYEQWDLFFNSENKYYYRGNLNVPEGYITIDYDGKINLKEDFYFFPTSNMCPNFLRDVTTEIYSNLLDLSTKLLNIVFGKIRKLNEDLLKNIFLNQGLLRVINYPPLDSKDFQDVDLSALVRNPNHKDKNLLTILPSATQGGLEFQLPNGAWHKAFYGMSTLIVNGGILLEEVSNSQYQAVTHRVANPLNDKISVSRKAMAFFLS